MNGIDTFYHDERGRLKTSGCYYAQLMPTVEKRANDVKENNDDDANKR